MKKSKLKTASSSSVTSSSSTLNNAGFSSRQNQREELLSSRKTMRSSTPPNSSQPPNQFNQSQNNITSLDVAQSAERLMLRSYAADASGDTSGEPKHISEAISQLTFAANNMLGSSTGVSMNTNVVPLSEMHSNMSSPQLAPVNDDDSENNNNPPQQQQQQQQQQSSDPQSNPLTNNTYASSTECLHLTLMLRRTLSELDQRTKHLNEANLEKLTMHRQVEQCKLRLEKLGLESEELSRRTEQAEARAQAVIDDEARQITEAENRATAAEKRFEILVDWSRKEESRRMAAEESCRSALEKVDLLSTRYENNEGECPAVPRASEAASIAIRA